MRLAGRLAAWRGIARSIAVYRLDRRHRHSLRRFASGFVRPGELVFDIGAHVGDRTAAFAGIGARVVAVEAQPRLARLLRWQFWRARQVTVVGAAVGRRAGTLTLRLNTQNPTVASASDGFVAAASAGASGWEGQVWDETITVDCTTLDDLIARFGRPAFVKIDVEGFEVEVMAGLSPENAPAALSFEFVTMDRAPALRALQEAVRLGFARFDVSLGESHEWVFGERQPVEVIEAYLRNLPDEANSGDVYCWGGRSGGGPARQSICDEAISGAPFATFI
ncbi:FkbM family methyltransferase [Jiella pacifica]|uniref:FkbM family methyltransferase n=1 Tax=Jiella pacifica TaxID=2696469 RepID=A0A6N9SUT4_9HYPH|nr:FkbM family methyltransferase [Jiella pacifica]NDW02807.1 FkbM family methyltransferase [Jiella pacifica]